MQIKPTGWEFTGAVFCCDAFKVFASTEGCGSPDFKLSKNGDSVIYNGVVIGYCPFCGKEIELKKVDSDVLYSKRERK